MPAVDDVMVVPHHARSADVAAAAPPASRAREDRSGEFVPVPPPRSRDWDTGPLDKLLKQEDYAALSAKLIQLYDSAREPRVVNWCVHYGFRGGHVCPLFQLTRNMLRFAHGRVPSLEDLEFATMCGTVLLVRVAQDVLCGKLILARLDIDWVFTAVAKDVERWLVRWGPDIVPAPSAMAAAIRKWWSPEVAATLPQPAWVTAAWTSAFYGAVLWDHPSNEVALAFRMCNTVTKARGIATRRFVAVLDLAPSWPAVFEALRKPAELFACEDGSLDNPESFHSACGGTK